MTYMTQGGGSNYSGSPVPHSGNYHRIPSNFGTSSLDDILYKPHNINFNFKETYSSMNLGRSYVINLDKPLEVISDNSRTYQSTRSDYKKKTESQQLYQSPTNTGSFASPFLKQERPITLFISKASEIEGYVRETFNHVVGEEFPKNIVIKVLDEDNFSIELTKNNVKVSPGIMGFAINNNKSNGQNFIVLKENPLDMLMLTCGHEVGHVFTDSIGNQVSEEAKAFAFEIAWARKIKEHNIAGLRDSINSDLFSPAINGVHNVAFDFVKGMLRKGMDALSLYFDIARKIVAPQNPALFY